MKLFRVFFLLMNKIKPKTRSIRPINKRVSLLTADECQIITGQSPDKIDTDSAFFSPKLSSLLIRNIKIEIKPMKAELKNLGMSVWPSKFKRLKTVYI